MKSYVKTTLSLCFLLVYFFAAKYNFVSGFESSTTTAANLMVSLGVMLYWCVQMLVCRDDSRHLMFTSIVSGATFLCAAAFCAIRLLNLRGGFILFLVIPLLSPASGVFNLFSLDLGWAALLGGSLLWFLVSIYMYRAAKASASK